MIGINRAIVHRVTQTRILQHGDAIFRFIFFIFAIIIVNYPTAVIAMPYGSNLNSSSVGIESLNKKQPPSIDLSLLPSHSNHSYKPQYLLKYIKIQGLGQSPLPTPITTLMPIVKDENPENSKVQASPPLSQHTPISHMSIMLSKLRAHRSLQAPVGFNKKMKLERKYKYLKLDEKKLMKIKSISPPNYNNNRDRRGNRRKPRCFFSTIFSSCKRPFCGWFGFSTSLTSSSSPIFSHSGPHSPVSGDYYHDYDYDHHHYDYYDGGHYETQVDPEVYYNSYDHGHPEFSYYNYDHGHDGFYNSNFDTYDGNTNFNTDIGFDDHYDFDFSSDFDSGSSTSSMYDY